VLFEIQLSLGVISVALSLILVFLFFKVYWLQRQIFLLGLPFGFLLLALSSTFLGVHLFYPYVPVLSASLMWVRVTTQTTGFLLIALSYILSGRIQKTTKYNLLTLSLVIIIGLIFIFGLITTTNPPGLSIIYSINDLFTMVNLALLSYIIVYLAKRFSMVKPKISFLVSAPLAFGVFWLGQFSYLTWEYTRSDYALVGNYVLVGSQIARVISLILFIRIYYLATKEASIIDIEQTKQG
jgi:hypothetical protein